VRRSSRGGAGRGGARRHLAGHVGRLGDVLELEVVAALGVNRDAGLHRAQRGRGRARLGLGSLAGDLLGLRAGRVALGIRVRYGARLGLGGLLGLRACNA